MVCKLPRHEKQNRKILRNMRTLINNMPKKRIYPTHIELKNHTERFQLRPQDPYEIMFNGFRTISFTYNETALKRAKRK